MKVTKRLLAILMSICMMIGMISMTAFANGTGSITVQNQAGTNASVGGKTLNLFKIFKATTDGTNIAYEWIVDEVVRDGTTIKVNRYEEFFKGCTLSGNEIINDVSTPFTRTYVKRVADDATIHDVISYINGLSSNSHDFSQMAAQLHQYIHDKKIEATDTSGVISAAATSYKFDNLELGYYMIYDATDLTHAQEAVRSAAMLAHPGENKVISLKADRPHIVKYVDDNDAADRDWKSATTANIGDIVTFRIVTMIPDHELYGDQYHFEISDIMADGLELIHTESNPITVTVTEPSAVDNETEGAAVTTPYDLKVNLAGGVDFTVNFTNITNLEENTVVEIVYDAKVTSTAALENANTAKLTYSNDPHKTTSRGHVESTANVYLWKFILTKYMEDASGTPSAIRLDGAKFEIYKKTDLKNPLKFTTSTATITENGEQINYTKYVYNPEATTAVVTQLETFKATDDGKRDLGYTDGGHLGEILIWGLGEGNYIIREVEAPAGYQAAKGDFEFTVTDEIGPAGTISNATIQTVDRVVVEGEGENAVSKKLPGQFTRVLIDEANQKYYIGITNRPGQALPETGGIGSTIYMVAGLAIMVSAAAVLVYKKRNSAK